MLDSFDLIIPCKSRNVLHILFEISDLLEVELVDIDSSIHALAVVQRI
jgi:hypothetical protein